MQCVTQKVARNCLIIWIFVLLDGLRPFLAKYTVFKWVSIDYIFHDSQRSEHKKNIVNRLRMPSLVIAVKKPHKISNLQQKWWLVFIVYIETITLCCFTRSACFKRAYAAGCGAVLHRLHTHASFHSHPAVAFNLVLALHGLSVRGETEGVGRK